LKSGNEIESFITEKTGTFISEALSIKGPSRLWWTADKISEIAPYPFVVPVESRDYIWYAVEFRPFGKWCFEQYTSPKTGKGFLIDIPVRGRRDLLGRVMATGCISTYSREARDV